MSISYVGRMIACLCVSLVVPASQARAEEPRRDAYGDPLPAEALLRLGTARFHGGHGVIYATLSPRGDVLAVPRQQEGICLLDAVTGKELGRLQPPGEKADRDVYRPVYSPDGSRLAFLFEGCHVLDVRSGKQIGRIPWANQRYSSAISLSRDGKRLAAPDMEDDEIRVAVWDVDNSRRVQSFSKPEAKEFDFILSEDGQRLATWGVRFGGDEETVSWRVVQLWDVATGKALRKIEVDAKSIEAVVFSPDGKALAIADDGPTVSIWDVESGQNRQRWAYRCTFVRKLRYSPDGKHLVAASLDGAIQMWEPATNKRLNVIQGPPCLLEGLAFPGEGKVRVVGSLDFQTLQVWEAPSGRLLSPRERHTSAVTALVFNKDGTKLLSGAGDGVRRWEVATGKCERHVSRPPDERWLSDPPPVQFAPDGRYVLYGKGLDDAQRLLDIETNEERFRLHATLPGEHQHLGVFSADSSTLAAICPRTEKDGPRPLRVWRVDSGQIIASWFLKTGIDHAVSLSPDGRQVLTASHIFVGDDDFRTAELTLWDLPAGRKRWEKRYPAEEILDFTFNPDGACIAAHSKAGTRLLDALSGKELLTFAQTGYLELKHVAFSPDGRTLALADGNGDGNLYRTAKRLRLWETATGKLRAEIHDCGNVAALAFSPDGRVLAIGGSDTTVLLCDLTGRLAPAVGALSKPTPATFDALWDELADADAEKAYRRIQQLMLFPAESVALVKKKLSPARAPKVTTAEIERWIADLEHNEFARREQAQQSLAVLGKTAGPALTKALQGKPTSEQKRRLEELVEALERKRLRPEMVRPTRALEVLERIGTAEAKQVLEDLATGDADAALTQEAKATLRRLAREGSPMQRR